MSDGKTVSASQMLERFLFIKDSQYQYVSTLSGGERKRLYLLTILMKNPNFLILDEPTNDLDIDTLNVLESFLNDFGGCLLIVSHDRYFIDRLVDQLFVFKGDEKISEFYGNYSDYTLQKKANEQKGKKVEVIKPKQEKKKTKEVKLSFNEKYEFEQLEKEIEQLELNKKGLTKKINSGETAYEELTKWSNELKEVNANLETKTERWMSLAARAE